MWETIIGFAVSLVSNIFTGWFDSEKGVEAEWKARTYEAKMKSYRTSDSVEREIKKSKPVVVPKKVSEWNKGIGRSAAVAGLLFMVLILSGCGLFTRHVYVEDRKPIIEIPARPALKTEPEFNEREKKLVEYSVTLESKILQYNAWADKQNIKNGYTEKPDEDESTDGTTTRE